MTEPYAWVRIRTDGQRTFWATDIGDCQPLYLVSPDAAEARALAAEAKCDALREAAVGAAAALAAAISVLERTPKAAKVAPSDRMFDQMLSDYRAALEVTRRALTQEQPNVGE